MLSIIAAGYLVICDFHACRVLLGYLVNSDFYACRVAWHIFRGITLILFKEELECFVALDVWGFFMYQDGGPNVEFCFFSLEERGFKSIMPIWLSCFWIFGKVVKRVNY